MIWINMEMAKVSSPYLSKSYYNVNCIRDLSLILIFATPAGGHKCTKEHLGCPNRSGIQWRPAKALNFDFDFVSMFKATSSKKFDWFKRFLTQTVQGRRRIKDKILNMADTFLDMAAIPTYPFFLGNKVEVISVRFHSALLLVQIGSFVDLCH